MKVAIFLFATMLSAPSLADTITGHIQMKDADSVYVDGKEIRLSGVDAPEWSQVCTIEGEDWNAGQEASAWARSFVANGWASCTIEDKDRYGRYVAVCLVDGRDLSDALVRNGYAFAYRHYSKRYVPAEDEAKAARRGIWAGECMPPWDWRKAKRDAKK